MTKRKRDPLAAVRRKRTWTVEEMRAAADILQEHSPLFAQMMRFGARAIAKLGRKK